VEVTIIGAGNMGRSIATRAIAGGTQLEIVDRDPPQLVSDGGLRPLDVGPLSRAQQLEHLGFLHISLQEPHKLNFGSAIKLHP
jgi:predicted dinucleotide-binding enzyme